jgi:hypothetical protein
VTARRDPRRRHGRATANRFFALPGDSGALMYDPDGSPVGMVWGFPTARGEVEMSWTFYTPFGSAMSSLTAALAGTLGRGNFSLDYPY